MGKKELKAVQQRHRHFQQLKHEQLLALLNEEVSFRNALSGPHPQWLLAADGLVMLTAIVASVSLITPSLYTSFVKKVSAIPEVLLQAEHYRLGVRSWLTGRLGLKQFEQLASAGTGNMPLYADCMGWARRNGITPWDSGTLYRMVRGSTARKVKVSDCYAKVAKAFSEYVALQPLSPEWVYRLGDYDIQDTLSQLQSKLRGVTPARFLKMPDAAGYYDYFAQAMKHMRGYDQRMVSPTGHVALSRVYLYQCVKPLLTSMWEHRWSIAALLMVMVLLHRLVVSYGMHSEKGRLNEFDVVCTPEDRALKRDLSDKIEKSKCSIEYARTATVLIVVLSVMGSIALSKPGKVGRGTASVLMLMMLMLAFIAANKTINYVGRILSERQATQPLPAGIERVLDDFSIDYTRERHASGAELLSLDGVHERDVHRILQHPHRLTDVHIDKATGQLVLMPAFNQYQQLRANLLSGLPEIAAYQRMHSTLKRLCKMGMYVRQFHWDAFANDGSDDRVLVVDCVPASDSDSCVALLQRCFPEASIERRTSRGTYIDIRGASSVDDAAIDAMIQCAQLRQRSVAVRVEGNTAEMMRSQDLSRRTHDAPTRSTRKKMKRSARVHASEAGAAASRSAKVTYPDRFSWVDEDGHSHQATRIPNGKFGGMPMYLTNLLTLKQVRSNEALIAWVDGVVARPSPLGNRIKDVSRSNFDRDGRHNKGSKQWSAHLELRPGRRSGLGKYRVLTRGIVTTLPKSIDPEQRRVFLDKVEGYVRNTSKYHS